MRSLASAPPEPHVAGREKRQPVTLGSFVTVVLLLGILFTGPLILGGARHWVQLPLLEVTAFLMLVQALRIGLRAGTPIRIDVIDMAVIAFTAYAIARWLTSPTEYYSRLEILNVVGYATVFLTCRYGFVRRSHALLILLLLVALGIFELLFGYYLSAHLDWCPFGPNETLHQLYAPRWVGTYGCPNHYGALLYMAMGAALAWGAFSKLSWPMRIVLFYVAALMMAGVVCSASRGSLLGACAAIIALTIFGVRYGMVRWWVPTLGGIVLLGFAGFAISQAALFQERVGEAQHLISQGNLQAYIRIVLARDALRIAHDYPFFGTGPATFVFIHPRYQDIHFGHRAVLTHDDYLNCLADYGGIGFAIALVFIVAVTIKFFRRPRAASRWQDRVLLTAGFTAWAGLLLHSFVDFNLHVPANAFMIFALTGMSLRRFPSEPALPRVGLTLPRVALAGAVAICALAFGALVARTAISDLIFEHADAQSLDALPIDTIAGARAALAVDSDNVPALVLLGDIYRMEAAHQDNIEQRLAYGQQALEAYQRAQRDNPLDDTITASLGLTYDIMYRYPEAYFCYADALGHQPYDGQFWFRLGNHFWETNMLEKAEQAYRMGLLCPNGSKENVEPAQEIRGYLAAQGIPLPPPGTDPLKPDSHITHATVP
jgi:O-antigen ligase